MDEAERKSDVKRRRFAAVCDERDPALLEIELSLGIGFPILDQRKDILGQRRTWWSRIVAAQGGFDSVGIGRLRRAFTHIVIAHRRPLRCNQSRLPRNSRASRNPKTAASPTATPGLLRTNSRASSPSSSTFLASSLADVSCRLRDARRA